MYTYIRSQMYICGDTALYMVTVFFIILCINTYMCIYIYTYLYMCTSEYLYEPLPLRTDQDTLADRRQSTYLESIP